MPAYVIKIYYCVVAVYVNATMLLQLLDPTNHRDHILSRFRNIFSNNQNMMLRSKRTFLTNYNYTMEKANWLSELLYFNNALLYVMKIQYYFCQLHAATFSIHYTKTRKDSVHELCAT